MLRDNENTQVVAERMLRPLSACAAASAIDADASILPVRAERPEPDERTIDRYCARRRPAYRRKASARRCERKEDDRFLRGRGEYVANLRLVGMRDVAFVRSPVAHGAHRRGSASPRAAKHRVFTIDDLDGVTPIVADSA